MPCDPSGIDLTEGVPGIVSDAPTCVPLPALGLPPPASLPPITVSGGRPIDIRPVSEGPQAGVVIQPLTSGIPDLQDEVGDPQTGFVFLTPSARPRLPPVKPISGGTTVAAPPPIAAPGASGAVVSAGAVPFGPMGAAVAPFAFALEPPPPAPAVYTLDELLEEAIARTPQPSTGAQLLEEAIAATKQPTLLEAAIAATPQYGSLEPLGAARAAPFLFGIPELLAKALGPVALLLQTTEAGPSLAQEQARVSAELGPPIIPTPALGGNVTGLPPDSLVAVPPIGLNPIVVTARNPPPALVVDPLGGLASLTAGIPELSAYPGPVVGPRPRARPIPQAPSVSPLPGGLTAPFALPTTAPGAAFGTNLVQSQSNFGPKALPSFLTQTQPQRCPSQKKPTKKKKPRTICYRGSYIEHRNGLTKHRKERIECQ